MRFHAQPFPMTVVGYHVECRYRTGIDIENRVIVEEVERRLGRILNSSPPPSPCLDWPAFVDDEILRRALDGVFIAEPSRNGYTFHHYQFAKIQSNPHAIEDDETDKVDFFTMTAFPAEPEFGSWESLHYESDIKDRLLSYATALMSLSISGVNMKLFDLHKILMLYGPPGCGKTSLSKALTHKLAIRARHVLGRACDVSLVQVNCHSLFSKWFSESGKKIMQMFDEVRALSTKPNAFICLLIDEIESLTISRNSLFKGSEPSDSIRAVNVLLTQIDQIKLLPNVMILTTSNLLETVDPAFLDRIDLKLKLGQPSARAKFEILKAGIRELLDKGLVIDLQNYDEILMGLVESNLSEKSGRSLKKMPFLALTNCMVEFPVPIIGDVYLEYLKKIAEQQDDAEFT